jgi:hypothetical protein
MGPVEQAFRSRLRAPSTLRTISRGATFVLRSLGHDGIVIELGAKRTATLVTWDCLESIPDFLRANPGWVVSGGLHSTHAIPGTLDAHLKRYVPRDIANWIVVLLRDAGTVDVDPGPPLRLRLKRNP